MDLIRFKTDNRKINLSFERDAGEDAEGDARSLRTFLDACAVNAGSVTSQGKPEYVFLGSGRAAFQGKRLSMEDRTVLEELTVKGKSTPVTVAAVFDGHGGDGASTFASEALAAILANELDDCADISDSVENGKEGSAGERALNRSFRSLCETWANPPQKDKGSIFGKVLGLGGERDQDKMGSGTTATIALVEQNDGGGPVLRVLNCGDSRAVLFALSEPFGGPRDIGAGGRGGQKESGISAAESPVAVVCETIDHAVSGPDEIARVVAAGGSVSCSPGGVMRIRMTDRRTGDSWKLAVARALTSKIWLNAGVSNEADLYEWKLSGLMPEAINGVAGFCLVVASDGIWGTVGKDDAARAVGDAWRNGYGGSDTARHLCETAASFGSSDNICSVVIHFTAQEISNGGNIQK
mmetsp:Transcript_44492/g.75690  ORF Transcript_44492/g.75690 Transcript_44492/m.75690 type:complete len:410 (-) Transcript_44492:198-1427(-)